MVIKTCGTKSDVKTGAIKSRYTLYVCEPNGNTLFIFGNKQEILNIDGVFTADQTKIDNKFICQVDADIYQGVKWEEEDSWGSGLQMFEYDPEKIVF